MSEKIHEQTGFTMWTDEIDKQRRSPAAPVDDVQDQGGKDQKNNHKLVEVTSDITGIIGFSSLRDKDSRTTAELYAELEKETRDKSNAKNTNHNLIILSDNDNSMRRIVIYDAAKGEILHNKKEYANIDHLRTEISEHLAVTYKLETTVPKMDFLINRIAYRNRINSIIMMYELLPAAPKENPLPKLASFITTNRQSYFQDIFDLFLKKATLQVFVPEFDKGLCFPNDVVPVLQGDQGKGKTTLIKRISLPGLYYDTGTKENRELTTRDGILNILGMDIGEFGEMRPGHIEKLKALISSSEFTIRRPYARGNITCPRTISFIGSTNHTQYLQDNTGNRRYFPITIESIDFDLFTKHGDLFYLVRAYYRDWAKKFIQDNSNDLISALYTIRPTVELEQFMEESREEVRVISLDENLIDEYIDNVKTAAESNEWSEFPNRKHYQFFDYLQATEAASKIYPGVAPKNFNQIFAETAKNYGYTQKIKQMKGRRFRIWIPKEEK